MLKIQDTLTHCGFNPTEAKIYLALLQNNNLKAGQIAKITGIKRASTYTTLDSLTKKGLVSISAENGILFFHAEPPIRIKEYLVHQQHELNQKVNTLAKIEKDLERLRSNELNIPKISIFTGKTGVRTLLEQTLNDNQTKVLIFGDYFNQGDPIPFYTKKRKSEKIKAELITPKSAQAIKAAKKDDSDLRKSSFLPNDYSLPASIHIADNKVTIFTHSNEQAVGVLIQDKDIAQTLTSLHLYVTSTLNPGSM